MLRAQLLLYSPVPDSPDPLDVLQGLYRTTSPYAIDASTAFSPNVSAPAGGVEGSSNSPPCRRRRRSTRSAVRSSLSVDPRVASRDGSVESVQSKDTDCEGDYRVCVHCQTRMMV